MAENQSAAWDGIRLGDPVPWFSASTIGGGHVDLHVDAGRWVFLAFLGSLDDGDSVAALRTLLGLRSHFDEQHLVVYVIFADPPETALLQELVGLSGPALNFLADYDGQLAGTFQITRMARTIVLDAMMRAVADIAISPAEEYHAAVTDLVHTLPSIASSAGAPLIAPVLQIPRVFDFELCDLLVELFDEAESRPSGFLLDQDGTTRTVVDPALKRRRDYVVGATELQNVIRDRVVSRVLPALERYMGFAATRMDRMMVCRYGAEDSGHFFRHRDNLNAGAQHRRFAMTIGLNKGFEGGGLRFPEFGPATYTAPVGAALVFSCGMLHEVLPVTAGARYVFVPFLYGEADALRRLENNRRLAAGEQPYIDGHDRLFPV